MEVSLLANGPSDWRIYQVALVSTYPPHVNVRVDRHMLATLIKEKGALFARWTDNWDCDGQTSFWYVIKDSFVPLENMLAKQRSEIKRGFKNCDVRMVTREYIENFGYGVYMKASASYSTHLEPMTETDFKNAIGASEKSEFWAVFIRDTDLLIAYSHNILQDAVCYYSIIKFDPDFLNLYPGYALIHTMNQVYLCDRGFRYVSDGARNISHDTNIQDYLIKKFGFRRAYCRLNILYRPDITVIVKLLFPFRKLFLHARTGILAKVASVLVQEEIRREAHLS